MRYAKEFHEIYNLKFATKDALLSTGFHKDDLDEATQVRFLTDEATCCGTGD